jgi:hypothetical protein
MIVWSQQGSAGTAQYESQQAKIVNALPLLVIRSP